MFVWRIIFLLMIVALVGGTTPSRALGPSISGGGTTEDMQNSINNNRIESARIFRELVETKVQNGEAVTYEELSRIRMSITGGDPGAGSLIPDGEALQQVVTQANARAAAVRAGVAAQSQQHQKNSGVASSSTGKTQEEEALGLLKKAAGYVGASDACHRDQDASSAFKLHEALLAAAIKNNILPAELASNIRDMGRKTSNETLSLFKTDPPMSCAEVHKKFLEFRTSIFGDTAP